MKANPDFAKKPQSFWATVRSISQEIGYSKKGKVFVPTVDQMVKAFEALGLDTDVISKNGQSTELTNDLIAYYTYRTQVLNEYVEPRLMDAVLLKNSKGEILNDRGSETNRAKAVFDELKKEFNPTCPIPMNKQKGEKKAPAYLTAIINMIVEKYSKGYECDYDPRKLTTVTKDGAPLRTLARRVDGAFPSSVNPIALWEIKEYYYTTTFGSRVADAVYETLLDGLELEELREHENIDVHHYLMVDSHYTWWVCGKSYLCRMIDILHMGYVHEVLFGYEVVERLPDIVNEWVDELEAN